MTFEDVPLWLECILRLAGVVQYSEKKSFKLAPWPIVILYVVCVVCIQRDFGPVAEAEIVEYTDLLASHCCIMCTTVLLYMFRKRSDALKMLLNNIADNDTIVPKKRWFYDAIHITVVCLFTFVEFACVPGVVFYILVYRIPLTIISFEYVFQSVILGKLLLKLKSVNGEMSMYRHNVTVIRKSETKTRDLIKRIQNLAGRHYRLVEQVGDFNKMTQSTIMCALFTYFLTMILTIYGSVIMYKHSPDLLSKASLVNDMLFVCYFYFWLYVQVRAWNAVELEANKTYKYVHEIWHGYSRNGEVNGAVEHLTLVSVQLLHHKVRFTVHGCFYLDGTLYHLVLASITTYVIILIQFKF